MTAVVPLEFNLTLEFNFGTLVPEKFKLAIPKFRGLDMSGPLVKTHSIYGPRPTVKIELIFLEPVKITLSWEKTIENEFNLYEFKIFKEVFYNSQQRNYLNCNPCNADHRLLLGFAFSDPIIIITFGSPD